MVPLCGGQSTSCVTITSRTAFMERKLRMSRPRGSVLNSRVSTDSAGTTSSDWSRPVFVSRRKSSRTPRTWPSSVMTVFPRNSVANSFNASSGRVSRGAYFSFLASPRRDVEAKPSELLSNEDLQLVTSLSYTIRGVFAGHLPRPNLGPHRHRTELFSRPRHLRRGSVQSRDERLLGRESGHAARSTEAARGDGPPGGLSAPDGGSQAQLGVPRE